MPESSPSLSVRSTEGRGIVAAAVLGSGAVFVESTVVSVALPAMGHALGLGMTGLQWIVNSYLVTLSALILLGGALGDALGQKRVFQAGLVGFALGSILCAVAPDFPFLIAARLVQGAAGALLVPTSLAFLDTSFPENERGLAIGQWAAWSAVSTAGGPLVGGLLVDLTSWRWVFVAASPLPLLAFVVTLVLPRRPSTRSGRRVDFLGGLSSSAALGALVWALLTASDHGIETSVWLVGSLGVGLLAFFVFHETRTPVPLLPPRLFASRQFAGANGATLLVYAAIGTLFFLLVVYLQTELGYSALAAGASLLPINVAMLVLSPLAGRWASASGPRQPIALGAAVAALGLVLLAGVGAGSRYVSGVLPGVTAFGCGLGLLVAPITSAVLAAVGEGEAGVASGVNNATARLASLLATAAVPVAVGLGGLDNLAGGAFARGFSRAMWVAAGLCAAGGLVAWRTVLQVPATAPRPHPAPTHGCVPTGARADAPSSLRTSPRPRSRAPRSAPLRRWRRRTRTCSRAPSRPARRWRWRPSR